MLEISEQSNDDQIKQAYLAMVRRHPPERDPGMFQKIYDAYDLISSEEKRLAFQLFHRQMPDPVELAEVLLGKRSAPACSTAEEFAETLQRRVGSFCRAFKL